MARFLKNKRLPAMLICIFLGLWGNMMTPDLVLLILVVDITVASLLPAQ